MKLIFCSVALIASCLSGIARADDVDVANTTSFYLSLNALALTRSEPQGGAIVSSNPGGVPFLSASDLRFDKSLGIDASAGVNFLTNETLEVRLMYSKADGDNSFVSSGSFIGVGFTGPGGTSFVSDFDTKFGSAELNWRHSYNDHFKVLIGLRALEVSDSFSTVLNANVATGIYDAENSLLGAQIGAQILLLSADSPFQITLSGKVGAFANESSAGISEFQGNNPIGGFQSGKVNETSYAAEIGVTTEYELSESMVLTAGYQALWANNLALASNAASASKLNPSLLTNNVFRDDLWLHGASIGARMSF